MPDAVRNGRNRDSCTFAKPDIVWHGSESGAQALPQPSR
jgi:hypothetical protein